MKKSIKFLTLLLAMAFLSAFTDLNSNAYIETFGVSSTDPAQIKLTINSNHTFYYQDYSVSTQKIVVNGSWTLKRGKMILTSSKRVKKFRHVWTFARDGQVAKSRKGFTFYRLLRINS